jgi:hypothetical protein
MKPTGSGCDMYCLINGHYTSQAAETDVLSNDKMMINKGKWKKFRDKPGPVTLFLQ